MENLCKLFLKLLFNDESAEKSAVECHQVYDYTTHARQYNLLTDSYRWSLLYV